MAPSCRCLCRVDYSTSDLIKRETIESAVTLLTSSVNSAVRFLVLVYQCHDNLVTLQVRYDFDRLVVLRVI